MKASGIKTAPPGHHVSKEDRRALALVIAAGHRLNCTCGSHPKKD